MRKKEKEQVLRKAKILKQVGLFAHLPQYERGSSISLNVKVGGLLPPLCTATAVTTAPAARGK